MIHPGQKRISEGVHALEDALAILTTTHGVRHAFVQQLRAHLEPHQKFSNNLKRMYTHKHHSEVD